MRVDNATPDLEVPYILFGAGAWDFGLPDPAQVEALGNAVVENVVVAGAHDFNAWNQLFTTFARDFLWQREAFLGPELAELEGTVTGTSLNNGNRNALTVKLNRTSTLVDQEADSQAVAVLDGFVRQVRSFERNRKLTHEEAAALRSTAEKIAFNLSAWQ